MDNRSIWPARFLIGLVFFFNVQCALVFLCFPEAYAPAFDLSGESGEAAMRGFGILFLMWNVPYAFALYHPARYRISLIQAVIMQAIAFGGESVLRIRLQNPSPVLLSSIDRFIIFDGVGLLFLLIAWGLASRNTRDANPAL